MKHNVSEQDKSTLSGLSGKACGIEPIRFVQVGAYTTFSAEYAMEEGDFILHFFLPPELKSPLYWASLFPQVLDTVARAHFQAGPPRLRAAYTEEVNSWWLRANGYDTVLNKDEYIIRFLDKLDEALDQMLDTLTST